MVFAGILEHTEHCDFFVSTSRDKKCALRAASSLESTTREQRTLLIFSVCSSPYGNPFLQNRTENIFKRGFNLERTKFFEASLSDTLSRSNQLQSRLMPDDVTFSLHFITHVFVRIRKQRSQEEQPYITIMYNHI